MENLRNETCSNEAIKVENAFNFYQRAKSGFKSFTAYNE